MHRIPGPDGWRLLALVAAASGGWTLRAHRCVPRGERYGAESGAN